MEYSETINGLEEASLEVFVICQINNNMPETFSHKIKGQNQFGAIPNKCPICHHTIIIKNPSLVKIIKNSGVHAVFQCPNDDCQSLFIGNYVVESNSQKRELVLEWIKPINPLEDQFSGHVKEISHNFIAIYKQASEAKQRNLNQIAGPGFRKAFEFLIKDYAKRLDPEKHEEIEKSFAGNVVNNFIPDTRIQSVAKRALWLGNDETHYLRKWEEHDIEDLINLIQLTINWIEIERLSEKYSDEMPE